jgi:hypothetical protein
MDLTSFTKRVRAGKTLAGTESKHKNGIGIFQYLQT